jgi:hypothetical protein
VFLIAINVHAHLCGCSCVAHHHRRRPLNPTGQIDVYRRPPMVNKSRRLVWIICSLSTRLHSVTLSFHRFCLYDCYSYDMSAPCAFCTRIFQTVKFDRIFMCFVISRVTHHYIVSVDSYNLRANYCDDCFCTVCVITRSSCK